MEIAISNLDEVKEQLGGQIISILNLIFDFLEGVPPRVPANRFRVDHSKLIDDLDKLASSELLLKRDYKDDSYLLSAYALPLIKSEKARRLLQCMGSVFVFMRQHYIENLLEPITVSDFKKAVSEDPEFVLEVLCYLKGVSGWWSSLGNEFPQDDEAEVVVSEQVVRKESFGEFISQVYEWHYVNPSKNQIDWSFPDLAGRSAAKDGFFLQGDTNKLPKWFVCIADGWFAHSH